MIIYDFEPVDLMVEFEKLPENIQSILAWKSGMYGMVKTNKTLAKELRLTETEIESLYKKHINELKNKILSDEK